MTGFYAIGEVATGSVGDATSTADTTAPTLTNPSVSSIGSTSAIGSVTTNESGGTLYWLASASAVVTALAVKAGSSKAVITAGAQTVNVTGLTASTVYYLHFLHADASSNESAVVNTATFTTANAPDTTGPVMDGSLLYLKTSTTTTITVPAQTDPSGIGEYFFAIDGGAFVSNGTSRTKTYTGLAPLSAHLYEVKGNDTFGNPSSNSISITVVTDAAGDVVYARAPDGPGYSPRHREHSSRPPATQGICK